MGNQEADKIKARRGVNYIGHDAVFPLVDMLKRPEHGLHPTVISDIILHLTSVKYFKEQEDEPSLVYDSDGEVIIHPKEREARKRTLKHRAGFAEEWRLRRELLYRPWKEQNPELFAEPTEKDPEGLRFKSYELTWQEKEKIRVRKNAAERGRIIPEFDRAGHELMISGALNKPRQAKKRRGPFGKKRQAKQQAK